MTTGFAGCGRMGAPMLAACLGADIPARGYDIAPVSGQPVTDDPVAFMPGTETLFTVVRDEDQTHAALDALLPHADALARVVVSSTLSPNALPRIAARLPTHVTLIDAPMSGAPIAAQQARLSFMLGGTPDSIAPIQPQLDAMGAHFHYMGGPGAGMRAKVLNNLLAASHVAMTRLVLDLADAAGLDEKKLLDLIHTSSGQNWLASNIDTIEFGRHGHAPDNSIGILEKDVAAAIDAAPPDADLSLPHDLHAAIRALRPRAKPS